MAYISSWRKSPTYSLCRRRAWFSTCSAARAMYNIAYIQCPNIVYKVLCAIQCKLCVELCVSHYSGNIGWPWPWLMLESGVLTFLCTHHWRTLFEWDGTDMFIKVVQSSFYTPPDTLNLARWIGINKPHLHDITVFELIPIWSMCRQTEYTYMNI